MPVPKRKVSKSRKKMRKAYNSVMTLPQLIECPNCGEKTLPHKVCHHCGYYKGQQYITKEAIV